MTHWDAASKHLAAASLCSQVSQHRNGMRHIGLQSSIPVCPFRMFPTILFHLHKVLLLFVTSACHLFLKLITYTKMTYSEVQVSCARTNLSYANCCVPEATAKATSLCCYTSLGETMHRQRESQTEMRMFSYNAVIKIDRKAEAVC